MVMDKVQKMLEVREMWYRECRSGIIWNKNGI
jgi:hypothetical protein